MDLRALYRYGKFIVTQWTLMTQINVNICMGLAVFNFSNNREIGRWFTCNNETGTRHTSVIAPFGVHSLKSKFTLPPRWSSNSTISEAFGGKAVFKQISRTTFTVLHLILSFKYSYRHQQKSLLRWLWKGRIHIVPSIHNLNEILR